MAIDLPYSWSISPPQSSSSLDSQQSLPSVPSLQISVAAPQFTAVAALSGHTSYVSSLLQAGKLLFSSSSDGTVRVWSRDGDGEAGLVVVASRSAVKSVVVSGDRLYTAHHDHKIRVWQITERDNGHGKDASYRCEATLPTLSDRVSRIFSSKNYVTVRKNKKRTWVHHNDAVSALAVSPDGAAIFSASWDRTFKVWSCSGGDFRCLQSVCDAHSDAVNAIAAASDGRVFTGSADRRIRLWSRRSSGLYTLDETLEEHRSAVNALAVSPNGEVLYSGACDRSILVWERRKDDGGEKMVVAGALRGHGGAILCLGVVADLVCSGSADCSIRVWKRSGYGNESYGCLAVLEGHKRPVKSLTLLLDPANDSNNDDNYNNYLVYSGGLDCEIRVWKVRVENSKLL